MDTQNSFHRLLTSCVDAFYRAQWKLYDRLYMLTGWEMFFYLDEGAVYNEDVDTASPGGSCCLPFNFVLPMTQEGGNEYFVVCDHVSRFKCRKAAKVSFYRPEYVADNFYLGKTKWVFSQEEKERLMAFLMENTHFYTHGKSWYSSLIASYNAFSWKHPISEDLNMPDYTRLPDK